jgi:hypothetical protein
MKGEEFAVLGFIAPPPGHVNIELSVAKSIGIPMRGPVILAIGVIIGVTVVGLVGITLISGGNSAQQPWQVVKNNVTVTGPIVKTVVCGVIVSGCPPECCTSIDNNQLINYQGNYYYVRNLTLGTNPGPAITTTSTEAGRVVTTIIAGQDQSTLTITVWFTNSTVYCISPAVGPQGNNWGVSAPTCRR